jgi:hypothetical protein
VAAAAAALGLKPNTLPREIRLGRLEARRRAGRFYILGRWLVAWLEAGEAHRSWGRPAAAPDGGEAPARNGAHKPEKQQA